MLLYLQQDDIGSPAPSISRQPGQFSPVHSFISVTAIAITTLSCSVRFIGFIGLQSVCTKFVQQRNKFDIVLTLPRKKWRIKEREEKAS